MAIIIDPNGNREVTRWDEFIKRKAFYIHGTTSSPERWDKWTEAVEVLNKIALPDIGAVDTAFDWADRAGQFNDLKDRWSAATDLVAYVKNKAAAYPEIVLIGHSHGGNIAIIAADKLAQEKQFIRVYVITVGTPVFNKEQFLSNVLIRELGDPLSTIEFQMNTAAGYQRETKFVYTNPENPVNWGKNSDKITHLSLYNPEDRVDGLAYILDLPGFFQASRMTCNTSVFECPKTKNIELVSNLDVNQKNRREYINHCSHRISMLMRLQLLIRELETPVEVHYTPATPSEGQDNTFVSGLITTYHSGYRQIHPLPEFKTYTLQEFIKEGKPEINPKHIPSMEVREMSFFFQERDFERFYQEYQHSSSIPLNSDPPFGFFESDPRTPNIKKIDKEIIRLQKEIKTISDFNDQTMKDQKAPRRYELEVDVSSWYNFLWGPFGSPLTQAKRTFGFMTRILKYLPDGVDNHSFDANSPELIQQAINEGRITPFERNRKGRPLE